MADKQTVLAIAGLAGLMIAEVPQVLSGFLPSPSTAYDKASGGIETGPDSMHVLNRSKVKGVAVSVTMAAAVSLMVYGVLGAAWAFGLFLLAMAVLWLFLSDFNGAIRRGHEHANGGLR